MAQAAAEITPPVFILMRRLDSSEFAFVDVRASVEEAERLLGRCDDPPEDFLFFDDRGLPLEAVRTQDLAVTLRPRDAEPDPELLWRGVGQALDTMERYLRDGSGDLARLAEPFGDFRTALRRHQLDPTHPVAPLPRVYGPYGLCCAILRRWCCACRPDDGDGPDAAASGG